MSSLLTEQILITIKYKHGNELVENLNETFLENLKELVEEFGKFTIKEINYDFDYNYNYEFKTIYLEIYNPLGQVSCNVIEELLDEFMNNAGSNILSYILCKYTLNENEHEYSKKFRRVHINKKGRKVITKSASKNIRI